MSQNEHAVAADLHTHAAYAHIAAAHAHSTGDHISTQDLTRKANQHSIEAARFSDEIAKTAPESIGA
jgi:hypothetical protein